MCKSHFQRNDQDLAWFHAIAIEDHDFPLEADEPEAPREYDPVTEILAVPEEPAAVKPEPPAVPEEETAPVQTMPEAWESAASSDTAEAPAAETAKAGGAPVLPYDEPPTPEAAVEPSPMASLPPVLPAGHPPATPIIQPAAPKMPSCPPDTRLDARLIPKFVNTLVKPPVYCPVSHDEDDTDVYVVDISQFKQQILPPGFPETTVWGYGGTVRDIETGRVTYSRSSPGATFETVRRIPIKVRWVNKLRDRALFAVDPTLHWANPNIMPMDPPTPWPPFPPGFPDAQSPVPVVTHLHGGEVSSIFDGHPDAWFTADGKKGPDFLTNVSTYPNSQESATLWYHDHALGITRLNVTAGLAGFYLLRDRRELCNRHEFGLPKGRYEIPIVIQDRSFYVDGSLAFPNVGVNPEIHPYWNPEFFGDAIMVNGQVWPRLDVERRQYRFRLLNGSNARFYRLRFSSGLRFTQIGTDGGFLPGPVELDTLLLAPAERADILVDFSCLAPGTELTLTNDAPAPFPDGDAPDPETTGIIMQFAVPLVTPAPVKPGVLPQKLNDIPALVPDAPRRVLTLNEVQGTGGPLEVLLNGQKWSFPITEAPRVGATEDWVIVNLTMDTHPIHLHLVQFLLHSRQDLRADDYKMKWEAINGPPPVGHPVRVLPVEPYLIGHPIPPEDNEKGWKDTVRMNPGQVTRIRVRFAPQDTPVYASRPGLNLYPFDPSVGPGYVWHCHILDHEDNEMMRPYKVRYY
jgi:FtsP/CotA-like multicopper oxidase with cupredoxin domain